MAGKKRGRKTKRKLVYQRNDAKKRSKSRARTKHPTWRKSVIELPKKQSE